MALLLWAFLFDVLFTSQNSPGRLQGGRWRVRPCTTDSSPLFLFVDIAHARPPQGPLTLAVLSSPTGRSNFGSHVASHGRFFSIFGPPGETSKNQRFSDSSKIEPGAQKLVPWAPTAPFFMDFDDFWTSFFSTFSTFSRNLEKVKIVSLCTQGYDF